MNGRGPHRATIGAVSVVLLPSPQPSPCGRGRCWEPLCGSLSLWERVGVRGSSCYDYPCSMSFETVSMPCPYKSLVPDV